MNWFLILALLQVLSSASVAQSVTPKELVKKHQEVIAGAVATQRRIDGLAERTQKAEELYGQLLDEIHQVQTDNRLLERQLAAGESLKRTLVEQAEQAQLTAAGIHELLGSMLKSISDFIELDAPFHLEIRRQRVAAAQAALNRHDLDAGEGFRQLWKLFSKEDAYNSTAEVYYETLELPGDTLSRHIRVLRVGRVGLYRSSLGGEVLESWDPQQRRWLPAKDGWRSPLLQAFEEVEHRGMQKILQLPLVVSGDMP